MTPVSFFKTTESYDVSSIGKPCMTPVSFVMTTETYEVYQWIIRGSPIGSLSGSRNGPKRAGLISASDQTLWAVTLLH